MCIFTDSMRVIVAGITVAAFLPLLLIMGVTTRDAISHYNIDRRQRGLPELPTGLFSGREASDAVLTCPLPAEMSKTTRQMIVRCRIWAGVFFLNLFLFFASFALAAVPGSCSTN